MSASVFSPSPLEQLRKRAGLSRREVSIALDVTERHLYRFERGQTPLRRPYAKTLAELYEQPLEKVEAAARKTQRNGNGNGQVAA